MLVDGVVHLDPASAVFEAMLQGWTIQQRARFLKAAGTIGPRVDLVRRLARFSDQYPWQWEPAEVEAFIVSLSIAPSTARNYQNTLRLFCEYAADPRYGWPRSARSASVPRRGRCCMSGTPSPTSPSTKVPRVGGR